MSREFDDELNRGDGERRRSRSGRNDNNSTGSGSVGRRRALEESDSYDEGYYFDDEPRESGYDQAGQDRDKRASEGYRAGSRRAPEGGRGAAGNGRPAGENGRRVAENTGNGRVAGGGGIPGTGAAGSGRLAGEAGGRGTGVPGDGRSAKDPGVRSMGASGSGGLNGPNRSGSRSAAQAAKKKKIRRIVITAIAEILTLVCIFSYAYVMRLDSRIKRPGKLDPEVVENQNLTPEQKQHMTGYWTIAVFGVDSRDGNVHKGTNADVIMLCNINRDTGEIRLTSVYRDTYLNIDEKSSYNKINSAYSNGGAEQTLAALNRNFDLNIQDYVTFNWKAVADGINMLDGVEDVNITKAEFRYINSFITETVQKTGVPSYQLKSAGTQHLDGVQAVAYGRLRLMDTDYARTERQRIIIQKAFDKAKKADLGLLNRILLMEVEQIETSLSFSDFTDLILDIGKYHIGESSGFPMTLGSQKMGKKGDCVIPQTLESNVIELHKFLYGKEDYKPSSMVTKISAKIAADSGMYKKGTTVDSHIPSGNDDETRETEKPTRKETNEYSDENITTSTGETVVETDEYGEPIETTTGGETRPTRPGETTNGETRPTRPGETTGDETRPTRPGESSSEETGPGESSSPAGPGETTAESTRPSSPGETDSTKPGVIDPSDNTSGPGVTPGTTAESSSAVDPTTAGPGGPGESGSPNGVTPGGDDNIFSEGPPGAA